MSGSEGWEKGRISTRFVPSFALRISGLLQLLCAAKLAYFKLVFVRAQSIFCAV